MSVTERDVDPGLDRKGRLQHVTVDRGEYAVCTIFPRDADENAMATEWLTASGDAFVSLRERR